MSSETNDVRLLTSNHANPRNPRKITPQQARALAAALQEFGDLGGIVLNRRTQRLVGGHQRVDAFSAAEVKVEITHELSEPDRTGTVAYGHIEMHGTRYSYREVDWDEARESAANLAANKHGGEFDSDMLAVIMRSVQEGGVDTALTGFSDEEITKILATVPPPPQEPVAPPVEPNTVDDMVIEIECTHEQAESAALKSELLVLCKKRGLKFTIHRRTP